MSDGSDSGDRSTGSDRPDSEDSVAEGDVSTANTLRERTDVDAYWFWVLVSANRWVVAGGLALLVFAAFVLWGVSKPVPLNQTMQTSDMVETVFSSLVGAIITVTTLVVSINQLVLSQEIGSLGTQRSRMDTTMDFRQNTDDLLGEVSPADPAAYLSALIGTTEQRAVALRETLAGHENDTLRERVDEYVGDLSENAEHARAHLSGSDFGTYDVLAAALDYNYDVKMHDLRRLGMNHESELSSEERAAFRDLLEALTMYGPAREYVKNLYIQWALVKLSRAILYATVVALTVAGGVVVFVDATTFTGTVLGVETMLWFVSAAFAVSTLPFLLFVSYILRLATIAKQTLSVGPLDLS
ncbi:hypothetical protein [Halobacterium zhouii]|uniref:hypothetical protein n=1 Tax=Halobacterium zhouii TaxID=2902624 RepID=UPI001E4E56B9|nr:hypothetical protein [Halobacterium zhouii]